MQEMPNFPKIRVITLTYDWDTEHIELDYDDSEMSMFEVWGLLKYAYQTQRDLCLSDSTDDEEDD